MGEKKKGLFMSIFMHADGVDVVLMVLGFVGAVGDGLGQPLRIIIAGKILNSVGRLNTVGSHAFLQEINQDAVLLCILAAGSWMCCFLEGYCWTKTGERQTAKMRYRYLKAVLRQDVGYFDLHVTSSSEIISSISSDSLTIQNVLSEKVPNFLMNISNFIGSYVMAFIVLWRLALVRLPFIIPLVVPAIFCTRQLMRLSRKRTSEYNKVGVIVEQAISSIRTVYAFVGENQTMMKFSVALEGPVKLGIKQGLAKGVTFGSNAVIYIAMAYNAWFGSKLVMYHGAQGGTVFNVGAILTLGGLAFGSSLQHIKHFTEAALLSERIVKVINQVPTIDSESNEGLVLENILGEVEFKQVTFAYPTRPESIIFKNFSLQVPAGKTVALVGGSGSGKSTAVALLQRFYDPLDGHIFVDGVPINKLRLGWLRSKMGLVSQEPTLFSTTIKDNILFGKDDATFEEIVDAAKASKAHNFISQLPQGYDTQVGERGLQMSGGEKQRIAIARAIINQPRILLLDEATSALDSESERVVQEALDMVTVGRTTIVIAHRLSTIKNVDLIAVIDNGNAVEIGSHDELISCHDGIYASLVRLQQMETFKDQTTIPDSLPSTLKSYNSIQKTSTICEPNKELDKITKSENINPSLPSFRRFMALSLPEWKEASIGCVSSMLLGVVEPLSSLVSGLLIAVYFVQDHKEIQRKTNLYTLWFLLLFVLTFTMNISANYSFARMGEYLTRRVREMMLSKILTFEVGWFDQPVNASGSVCSRLAKDANVVRSLVTDHMASLIQTSFTIVMALMMGFIIAWRLAIVMIPVHPLVVFCFYVRRVVLKDMAKKEIKTQNECSKLAAEVVTNIRTITAFSSQDRVLDRLKKAQRSTTKESTRQSWYAGIVLGNHLGVHNCAWALQLWYGGKLVSEGSISAKQFFACYMVLSITGRVIVNLGSIITDLAMAADTVSSIFAVLDRVTRIEPNDPQGGKLQRLIGHVEFKNVEFSYPTRLDTVIFKELSLKIEAQKSTALVGGSGSGKSSIISLIQRFYDPLNGVLEIDGRDIKTYNLRSLRNHVALVSQEPTLFGGTIRDNISYGTSSNNGESEIIEAAKAANAHNFISTLKEGYDTWCGDKGLQLSGGQKQRIAIARAILRNPSILLLDEATSALDSQSEKVLQDTLHRVMVGRTSIVVAHRLATIQNCNHIVVLDKGKVVEEGTHSSLLAKGSQGAYYSLVNVQEVPIL